jgi:hypothetical protein
VFTFDKSSTIRPEHEKKGRTVSANRSGPTQCSVSEDYTHNGPPVTRQPLAPRLSAREPSCSLLPKRPVFNGG